MLSIAPIIPRMHTPLGEHRMFQGLIAGALVVALLSLETSDEGAARAVGWVAIGAGLIGMGVNIAVRL